MDLLPSQLFIEILLWIIRTRREELVVFRGAGLLPSLPQVSFVTKSALSQGCALHPTSSEGHIPVPGEGLMGFYVENCVRSTFSKGSLGILPWALGFAGIPGFGLLDP